MKRKQLTQLNIVIALLHQALTAVAGLVLPRFILLSYGSEVNGLLQSVSQMLSYTTLMELGIGGAVVAALYSPLAKKNQEEVSGIFNYTKKTFGKISIAFIAFALILSVGTKFIVSTGFDFIYVSSLVLILAINTYFNYYFGLPHQLLMKADQKLYVVQAAQIVSTVINMFFCIWAIKAGATIHTVKFITAFVFLLNPLVYRIYVKRHYNINKDAGIEKKHITRTKDAVVHHWAYFIHRNTDIVILSTLRGVKSASVYSVYNAVILVLENLLNSLSTAVAGAVGNMIAKEEKQTLESSFALYEMFNTYFTAALSTVIAILIIPFVRVYTKDVTDVNYIQPVFAYLMIAAGLMYCIRMPYNTVITSAGHYRETRAGAIGEVCLNLGISILLVKPLGLSGVAIGTLVAMSFRTVYMVWYLSKNILHRPIVKFVKSFGVNLGMGITIIFAAKRLVHISATNLWELALYGAGISVAVFGVLAIVNILLNWSIFKKVRK